MKMALDGAAGVNSVKTYEPGRVQIRGRYFTRSLIVLPDQLFPDWQPRDAAELCTAHLGPIVEWHPEVLILGTGDTQVFPDPAIFATLMDMGVGFEVMDNAAACRTYNVLVAEQRRAALALILSARDD
ncbi:MAG: Mth938-like domain-containing protein [Sedimenticolaceae bacterium]|jgi:uncharacterized protein